MRDGQCTELGLRVGNQPDALAQRGVDREQVGVLVPPQVEFGNELLRAPLDPVERKLRNRPE